MNTLKIKGISIVIILLEQTWQDCSRRTVSTFVGRSL